MDSQIFSGRYPERERERDGQVNRTDGRADLCEENIADVF